MFPAAAYVQYSGKLLLTNFTVLWLSAKVFFAKF